MRLIITAPKGLKEAAEKDKRRTRWDRSGRNSGSCGNEGQGDDSARKVLASKSDGVQSD